MKKNNLLSILTYVFLGLLVLLKFFDFLSIVNLKNEFIPIVILIYFILLKFLSRKEYIYNYENKDDSKTVAIYLISSLIIYFLLGVFFGFSSNIYSYKINDILYNTFLIIIPILIYEYIRYYLIKHSGNNKALYVIITILIILININYENFLLVSPRLFYIKLFSEVVPLIVKNIILTIIMVKYGFKTCLVYQFIYTAFIIFCPFLPSVGYFLNFLILSGIPLIVYSRLFNEYKKKDIYKGKNYTEIITCIIGTILLLFCFRLFPIAPIAVISNSMNPLFERGDLVIYHKLSDDNIKDVRKNDIIVFNYDNNIYVHRVKRIVKKNDNIYFRTKGDANSNFDSNYVYKEDIIGIYKFKIKFLGYPSIWIEHLLN